MAELLREQGARVHGFDLPDVDLMKLETLSGHVDAVAQKEGGIDILVNNAGVTHLGNLLQTSPRQMRDVLTVNLEAPFLLMQAVIPYMLKAGAGRL